MFTMSTATSGRQGAEWIYARKSGVSRTNAGENGSDEQEAQTKPERCGGCGAHRICRMRIVPPSSSEMMIPLSR